MAESTKKHPVSMDTVRECQTRLEKELKGVKGVRGIGIAYDKERAEPQLKVLIDPSCDPGSLPDHIDDLNIRYDLIDDVELL
jgi:hypothetical protein